jgi:hypothetical protein
VEGGVTLGCVGVPLPGVLPGEVGVNIQCCPRKLFVRPRDRVVTTELETLEAKPTSPSLDLSQSAPASLLL